MEQYPEQPPELISSILEEKGGQLNQSRQLSVRSEEIAPPIIDGEPQVSPDAPFIQSTDKKVFTYADGSPTKVEGFPDSDERLKTLREMPSQEEGDTPPARHN